jgi:hypothetical protein
MADYILRANSPSNLAPGKVYLTEEGEWTNKKLDAKVFTAKTKATEAKKVTELEAEIITPDFSKGLPVENAV